ncbi:cerebral cortex development [Sparganum proliferum]
MSDSKPLSGKGAYNINWDEIDENTNPFVSGSKFGGGKPQPESLGSLNAPSPVGKKPISPSPEEPHPTDQSQNHVAKTPEPPKKEAVSPKRLTEQPAAEVLKAPDNAAGDAVLSDPLPEEPPPEEEDGPTEIDGEVLPAPKSHRRLSNSSAATFVLTPGTRSPVPPEPESELTMEEELSNLRAEKERLLSLVTDMQRCIAEYERSLQELAREKTRAEEEAKESVINIISERDQAIEEISTIEKAFGDLHRRFEKSKQIIEGFKKNEEVLKKSAEDYQTQLRRQEQKYQALKAHAEQKLMKVAEETEQVKRNTEGEVTLLRAAIKRSELQIKSLESQLEQKTRENMELTKICDELISKYSDKA